MMLPSKTQVILGPPGTGKTSTLLGLIEDELQKGTKPDKIGFFTFTKKAVTEGKDRAIAKFDNIVDKDLPYFRTLHSLAFRQLGLNRENVLGRRDILDLNEKMNLKLTGSSGSEDGHLFAMTHDDRLAFIENLARMRGVELKEQWHEVEDAVGWFELERYAKGLNLFKQDRLLVDYTDMLHRFLHQGDIPKLDVMYVDEAQDLSPLQWSVVRKLAENSTRVYIAGDDDQAIYKWAGADVDYLINNSKNAMVLKQSYRVPFSVHEVAMRCINQVRSRVHKTWNPREQKGTVRWEPTIDLINMESGEWLVLARTNYLLEQVDEYCRNEGWFFEVKGRPSISEKKVQSVLNWEKLRSGGKISLPECSNIIKQIKLKNPKVIDTIDEKLRLNMQEMLYYFPDLPQTVWFDAFSLLSVKEISYIRAMLRRGEKITKKPRIKLSTIHAAKGGECENVVLITDITNKVYKNYQQNPDDENRVFYVAVTRTKENLYLIEPQSPRCYQM
jgi:DNA helicase-2/ATP-dependent DNA helicase PcrA